MSSCLLIVETMISREKLFAITKSGFIQSDIKSIVDYKYGWTMDICFKLLIIKKKL